MSNWAWLSSSLSSQPDTFSDLYQCLAFQSGTELHGTLPAEGQNARLSSSTSILSAEEEVLTYLKSDTSESDICALLATPLDILRAFINPSKTRNGKLPLPISQKLFEHVVYEFGIASGFLAIMSTGLARYSCCIGDESRGKEQDESVQRFVVQQNRSHSCFSIALTFDVLTGRTRALVFGAEKWLIAELFAFLKSFSSMPYGPMVIPTVALELQANWFSKTIKIMHDQIHNIEATTGMRRALNPTEDAEMEAEAWKRLDLISITRDLSSFLSRLAFLKLQAETGAYLMQQMEVASTSLLESRSSVSSRFNLRSLSGNIQKIEEIRSWFLGIGARCKYLSERTAAQTQTVYTLIASQENMTNTNISRTSRDIAGMTRQDNQLMLRIADESRAVALITARDSAAMRVIAAVTVLFLPATFMAAFFSMSFFDFLGSGKERTSPWIWLYVLVTGILTVVTQIAWAIMSKKRAKDVTVGVLRGRDII